METSDLEADHPWNYLFAAPLRLDPSDALDRLVVQSVGDILAGIDPARFVSPLSIGVRRRYENTMLNFERWCCHEGFTEELGEAARLPVPELRLAVEEWLAWRVSPIDASHPLSVDHARRAGVRHDGGWRTTTAHRDPQALRSVIRWWAATHGLREIVSARSEEISGPVRAVRPARALTDAEIVSVTEALLECSAVCCVDEARREAWHARQLAVFNISLAVSLRQCELSMLRDENVVDVNPDGVAVRLPRTKQHPQGRIVQLRPRGDALCPVWALTRWLALCAERNWSRGGLLLPAVVQRRVKALVVPNEEHERRAWRMVTDHLGITDDVDSGLRSTPHGHRAAGLTRAVEAGWDSHDLMLLGDWSGLGVALSYDRGVRAPAEFVTAMGVDLASHHDARTS